MRADVRERGYNFLLLLLFCSLIASLVHVGGVIVNSSDDADVMKSREHVLVHVPVRVQCFYV